MKNDLFGGIGKKQSDSDSDEEEKPKAIEPAKPEPMQEMNLLDMDMGAPAIMPAPDNSTAPSGNLLDDMFTDNKPQDTGFSNQSVGDLLGSGPSSNPPANTGGFDLMGLGQP